MANVPVSVPQLEEIAASVAQDVMEWLVVENDYADEQLPELALYATNIAPSTKSHGIESGLK